jgi:hypothetical protein
MVDVGVGALYLGCPLLFHLKRFPPLFFTSSTLPLHSSKKRGRHIDPTSSLLNPNLSHPYPTGRRREREKGGGDPNGNWREREREMIGRERGGGGGALLPSNYLSLIIN